MLTQQIDYFYVINIGDNDIEDYANKRLWKVPRDNRPHMIPRELVDRYTRRRMIKVLTDINSYLSSNPEINTNYLVIRDGGIGDLILLSPCLKSLKQHFPRLHLAVACDEGNIPVVKCFPFVDEVVPIKNCDFNSYDYYDDLRGYSELSPSRVNTHRTDVFQERFHTVLDDKRPVFNFPTYKLPFTIPAGLPLVVIQGGTSHKYRDWPNMEGFIKQLVAADCCFIVVVDYQFHFPKLNEHNCLDLRCETTVEGFLNILSQADLVITPDSGALHVALAQEIPTLGLFGIIRPDYRVRYYANTNSVFYGKEVCSRAFCGETHMTRCSVGDGLTAKCMNAISIEEVMKDAKRILKEIKPQSRVSNKKQKEINPIKPVGNIVSIESPIIPKVQFQQQKNITLVCIAQNEEHNIPRWINNVFRHPLIARAVVIDGGSQDSTVKLLKDAGVEVYIHPYLPDYHDMQAVQRNISFTYVRAGDRCLVMDFDECFSKTLYEKLGFFSETNSRFVEISRRTYNTYKEAVNDINRIKNYPDYQPRFFIWDHKYKWVRSPHHAIYNAPPADKVQWDILHFEAEGKNRPALEKKWAAMQEATRRYYG